MGCSWVRASASSCSSGALTPSVTTTGSTPSSGGRAWQATGAKLASWRRAWKGRRAPWAAHGKRQGFDPASVGLVEAHGTATPAGDAAELETLRRVFGEPAESEPRAGLGSVKSMIGHAMPAAGAAGFIKAVLAVYHGVLPPTLHCDEPQPAVLRTRFRVVTKDEPWERGPVPRRAAVNAFGFGGINAHVVIEEHASPPRRVSVKPPRAGEGETTDPSIALFAAPTKEALLVDLRRGARKGTLEGSARLAVLDPTPERLARAVVIAEKGRPWRGREGIWFSPSGLACEGGRVALLFPGVDASFEPHVDDVAARYGLPVPPCTVAHNLEQIGLGIIGVNKLLHRVLGELGLRADFIAGHSIGEWSGMIAADMIPPQALDDFMASLRPGSLEVPGVVFAAAGCGVDAAHEAMRGLPNIDVSHDNCPHQILMCGQAESIGTALARLREAGVLCQQLPFKSGFHSPLFETYLDPHRANFARLPLLPPSRPFWSATICAEYPRDPDAIRALALGHLVRPVRFRELIEALYSAGARIFVQSGTGSLVHFVEDTLRGRPHVAVSANVKEQTGLGQLRRLAATLFVEGVDVRIRDLFAPLPRTAAATREPMLLPLGVPLVRLRTPLAIPAAPPARSDDDLATRGPLAEEFAASMTAIARAQADVLAALDRAPSAEAVALESAPYEATFRRLLSIETYPELRDHTFFRQPAGWPTLSDLHPVVPMTMSIDLIREAAEELVPGRVVVAIEGVRAYRWLVVSQPVEAEIQARFDGVDRVAVSIEGYAEATAVLGEDYPSAPPGDTSPIEGAHGEPVTGMELYARRWMFHGPAYQGITAVGAVGTAGIRGDLVTTPGRGALLDNAGQLFGYWVMRSFETDRLAMPVKIDRLSFFGPHPREGERLGCTVHIRRHGPHDVVADLSLDRGGDAWVKIEGWEDRRFETDPRLWSVMIFPENNLLAEPQEAGYTLFVDRYRGAPTRDQLARRFLGEKERAEYDAQGPRKQRAWLAGRIAAKDAVRDALWRAGQGPLFPVEVAIETGTDGRPHVRAPGGREVRVSIAHKNDVAVALASLQQDVGIDIEHVEARPEGFTDLAFTHEELRMGADAAGRDEWIARLWVAKEAAAKAAGTGLAGDPKRFPVTDRAGDRLLVAGRWVTLRLFGDYVIGWT
jgi:phosphopantetheinyl transferase